MDFGIDGIENKRRFTRVEAARFLGVSVCTVDRALADGRIACFRHGARVVFGREHLEEFEKLNECAAVKQRRKRNGSSY